MKALRKLPNGIDAEALALCTMPWYTVQAPVHLSRLWHPFKPCRCCLTAALYVLFETLLLEFCCIMVVFGLPALLFSMAVPATASSGLLAASYFARLCWLVMTPYTSPFLSSKSRRKIAGYVHATWLCTMDASLRKLVMSWFAFEQRLKPAYLLYIGDFTTRLYRDYSKSVFGFLWSNQYNGMSQGFECCSRDLMSTLDS